MPQTAIGRALYAVVIVVAISTIGSLIAIPQRSFQKVQFLKRARSALICKQQYSDREAEFIKSRLPVVNRQLPQSKARVFKMLGIDERRLANMQYSALGRVEYETWMLSPTYDICFSFDGTFGFDGNAPDRVICVFIWERSKRVLPF